MGPRKKDRLLPPTANTHKVVTPILCSCYPCPFFVPMDPFLSFPSSPPPPNEKDCGLPSGLRIGGIERERQLKNDGFVVVYGAVDYKGTSRTLPSPKSFRCVVCVSQESCAAQNATHFFFVCKRLVKPKSPLDDVCCYSTSIIS